MVYADGFLLAVPKKNLRAYKTMAKKACVIWMDHGALQYHECVGEDIEVKMCQPFTKAVKVKRGEVILFSWILYKNRKHRDRVNAAVMKDERMQPLMKGPMPFDMKRMHYGGFESIVDG
ncbi:MAG TPA: DUF1428 domain-containing protein [Planctomycetota bacterium]|nr:DUF1428 domain-containing protein [Planctomycetota bacterium]